MNISDAANWVGIADSTIRKYLKDFGDIDAAFSESAIPDASKHRRFTNRDVAVIAWIARQYHEHRLTTEAIHEALIRRIESGEPFDEPPHPVEEDQLALIPREQHEEILAANRRALELALAERDAIRNMLDSERADHKEERGEWQGEVARLNREIGRLAQMVRNLGSDPELDS
ncbi:MAG TPA: hypothetical protein VJZ27_19470 [Aggregatilineales bacterium]|nr:hypothetical protein [Aggregatilineales bacterium]